MAQNMALLSYYVIYWIYFRCMLKMILNSEANLCEFSPTIAANYDPILVPSFLGDDYSYLRK